MYCKLGRERAWGQSGDGIVEIDERLKGKKHLEILLHECLHLQFPEADEDEIIEKSIQLTNTLWAQGYRRIDNDTSLHLQDGKK